MASTDDHARPLSAGEVSSLRNWIGEVWLPYDAQNTIRDLLSTLDAAQARVGVLEQERATLWQFAVGVAGSVTRDQVDDVYARLPLEWRDRLWTEARVGARAALGGGAGTEGERGGR